MEVFGKCHLFNQDCDWSHSDGISSVRVSQLEELDSWFLETLDDQFNLHKVCFWVVI